MSALITRSFFLVQQFLQLVEGGEPWNKKVWPPLCCSVHDKPLPFVSDHALSRLVITDSSFQHSVPSRPAFQPPHTHTHTRTSSKQVEPDRRGRMSDAPPACSCRMQLFPPAAQEEGGGHRLYLWHPGTPAPGPEGRLNREHSFTPLFGTFSYVLEREKHCFPLKSLCVASSERDQRYSILVKKREMLL